MGTRIRVAALLGMVYLVGCADSEPAFQRGGDSEPISVQMLRSVPELKSVRFANLLDFESRSDTVFVSTLNIHSRLDDAMAHTGRSSLRLMGNSGKMTIKLASLLGTRTFPGDWTLAGAYFYTNQPAQITAVCDISGVTINRNAVTLKPGQWTPVMVDLVNPVDPFEQPTGTPSLSFIIECGSDVWCDDVLLIDNTQWIVGRPESQQSGKWTVSRKGLKYICGQPGFVMLLTPADVQPDGWTIEEANILRVRLSSAGKNKALTIYPDGRSYWDGAYRGPEPLWADQQKTPAEIAVPETMGRLNRRSPGDENNDGYNETRAAYMLVAAGGRMEITITPRSIPVTRPMLEIAGLPPGEVLATVEGRLVERVLRLEDGTLLVEIPGRIDRPTTVNIRVQ